MLRQNGKGWLAFGSAVALCAYLGAVQTVTAAEPLDGRLIAAASAREASAMPETSAPETEAAASGGERTSSVSRNTGEKISVTFEEPERDIMTKEALDKLNVIIESLEFANADLRNVIRIIGERLNINFIFDAEDISGKVTLRLHNIRLKDALDAILKTRKLALVPDKSGIFRIVPQANVGTKQVETHTEVLQLNWVNAVDVVKTLTPFLSDQVGKMQANEESNSLIVTDVPPQIETIKKLIAQIDLPERQVSIEARLVDINIGALRHLGTNWSASQTNPIKNYAPSTISDDPTGTGASAGAVIDPLGVANILNKGFAFDGINGGTLALGDKLGLFGSEFNINATFNFLETRNVVTILANPRVTTLNNVPADIKIVEKIPYQQAVQGPTQGTTTAEIEFEEAGENITVKPIITPNGFVRMEVKLEQRIFRTRVGTDPLGPPVIDVRNANTNVIVPDRSTIALGGLRQLRSSESVGGVPWLHRIPLFGWLFKDKNYNQDKTELVLMMTPNVIKDSVRLNEHEKYLYDKIDTDWHLPDYFFDETQSVLDKEPAKAAGFTKK